MIQGHAILKFTTIFYDASPNVNILVDRSWEKIQDWVFFILKSKAKMFQHYNNGRKCPNQVRRPIIYLECLFRWKDREWCPGWSLLMTVICDDLLYDKGFQKSSYLKPATTWHFFMMSTVKFPHPFKSICTGLDNFYIYEFTSYILTLK